MLRKKNQRTSMAKPYRIITYVMMRCGLGGMVCAMRAPLADKLQQRRQRKATGDTGPDGPQQVEIQVRLFLGGEGGW